MLASACGRQVAGGQHVRRRAPVLPHGRRLVRDRRRVRPGIPRRDRRLFPATPSITCRRGRCRERGPSTTTTATSRRGPGPSTCAWTRTERSATRSGARSPLEICDLLGPGNELIHVKRAEGSAPLSHLFSQGLISAQSLVAGPPTVRGAVRRRGRHGSPAAGAWPPTSGQRRSCTPSCWPNGKELTARHAVPVLPGQLAHAARILGTYGIERGGNRHPGRVACPAVSVASLWRPTEKGEASDCPASEPGDCLSGWMDLPDGLSAAEYEALPDICRGIEISTEPSS